MSKGLVHCRICRLHRIDGFLSTYQREALSKAFQLEHQIPDEKEAEEEAFLDIKKIDFIISTSESYLFIFIFPL